MILKRFNNHLLVIVLLQTKFLIKFGFAKNPPMTFGDFKHFPSLMSPTLQSKMTHGVKLPHLEGAIVTPSDLSSISRFVSPRPTRKDMGYKIPVRGPRYWDIKKTPQVIETRK